MGGPGDNAWIAYAQANGAWFYNALNGDICYRNTTGRLLLGCMTVQASVIYDTKGLYHSLPVIKASVIASTATSGNVGITADQMIGGYFVDGATQTAAYTFTTDTAANILAALPSLEVGNTFTFRYFNNDQSVTGYTATLAAGTGVTINSVLPNPAIPKGGWADYLVTCTDNTSGSAAFTVTPVGGTGI